jgi:GTP-binding protein EngB required for normal cell division
MRSLLEVLDLLDLAVARSRGVIVDEATEHAAAVAANVRARRWFLGDVLVVALAGGTGSGKSSLLNALAGEELASVSALRPHTDSPLAWVPSGAAVEIGPLLDDLGVTERLDNTQLPGLAIIDLPDMDSIAEWHRRIVDDLLPRVDAVVWVCDPEKYHDPVLHDGFLWPLAQYHRQFVFVLNKIDRLPADDRPLVQAHLTAILEDAGYPAPRVMVTAAAPDSGPPIGIEELIKHVDHRLDAKTAALTKLAEDVRGAAFSLAAAEGLWDGWGTGFTGVGNDPEAVVRSLAGCVGEPSARRLRDALGAEDPGGVAGAVAAALWDRAYLGATLASVGVAAAGLMADLDSRRLP